MTAPILNYRGRAGVVVDLDRLVASRLLVQANSGGGKSRAIRSLLEQTHGQVQHLVLDPEGEFASLRERFAYVLAGRDGDVPAHPKSAKLLCRRLVEAGASAVLDLYDLPLPERREFVKLFLAELMALPRALWRPLLVVIDEAHVFAPERGSGEAQSTEAVITLCTQGRKRGFAAVLATQRISKLHKDAAAELLNKLIGRTGLDVDVKRAGEELGFDKDQRQQLKRLEPGEFFVYGPAIANEVQLVRTAEVFTSHPEAGTVSAAPPPPPAEIQRILAQLADLPKQAEDEAKGIADLERLVRELRRDLKTARAQSPAADPARVDAEVQRAVTQLELRHAHRLRELAARLRTPVADLRAAADALDNLRQLVDQEIEAPPAPRASAPPRTTAPRRGAAAVAEPVSGVSQPQQRMLNALAAFAALGLDQVKKGHVAVFSDQSPRSSGFRANLSTLSAAGYVDRVGGDALRLTDAGAAIAEAADAPLSLAELHDAWIEKLSGPQGMMLRLLINEHPAGIEKEQLARSSGQSPLSSGYRANLSTLSALGLLERRQGELVATSLLFPAGLR